MTSWIFKVAGFALVLLVGVALGRWLLPAAAPPPAADAPEEREILYWKAPMDPSYRRDAPGKSPMGMDLVPVYADEAGGAAPGVVSIDPTVVNNLGVRTAIAERGPLPRRINTVGYVGYDEDTLYHVHSRVDGWVESLSINASGDPVRAGQVLFELYSPTLVSAEEEYLAAIRRGNAPLKEASRKRLVALGLSDERIAGLARDMAVEERVQVLAERDGVVAELGVREGIFITPATNIMSVADLKKVWVLAEVFERQADWVTAGQAAEVTLDYLPGERWRGRVDYVYPELDATTRTLRVRLRFDNPDERLRPNMFARVTILGTPTPPVVHVPREALIRGSRVDRVVVALGEGRYRAQRVRVGLESGDRVGIRRGLEEGDVVVTSGQFLIDSESNVDSALGRMEGTP